MDHGFDPTTGTMDIIPQQTQVHGVNGTTVVTVLVTFLTIVVFAPLELHVRRLKLL